MTTDTDSPLSLTALQERRERVFLALAGLFLCAMTLLNVIGISHFVQLIQAFTIGGVEIGPMTVAAGVLPYPLTFLCTDLISELYGKRRANVMVTIGLCLNVFILGVMWLIDIAPPAATALMPPWQAIELAAPVGLPNGSTLEGTVAMFDLIYATTTGAVVASMMAYIAAQYCDVHVFHWLKQLTGGKHLWIRNNFSTLTSQLVDSVVVISVTFGAQFFAGKMTLAVLLGLMGSNYLFKMLAALIDTLPFYVLTARLRRYLELEPATSVAAANLR
ncbi:MAG: queuosine precursor transporter [Pseudomonadota bacterium]